MTQDMEKESILQMESDKLIPRHVSDKTFMIRFPDRSEWKKGFQPHRKGGLIWYTIGSKTKKSHWSWGIATEQGGNIVLALGNTQQYSRQNYIPLRHVQWRI
jgi:hypothetical protein